MLSLEEAVRTKSDLLLTTKITHESALQAVKDEWRKEVEQLKLVAHECSDPLYSEINEVR